MKKLTDSGGHSRQNKKSSEAQKMLKTAFAMTGGHNYRE